MAVLQNMPGGRIPIDIAGVHEVELVELLGSGGFSYVWKVADTATAKQYTLKIIQALKPGSVLADRVRLEAEVAIPSEHIVAVRGLREWDANTFLILFEYFESSSLDALVETHTLGNEQKKRIFLQTLTGVSDAHRNNVIHRDIKPGNILVNGAGQVKLIDFGISKFKGTRSLTISGDIIGTWQYMAPELLKRGSMIADARCDIYSLGHVLYELSMGTHFWTRMGWGIEEGVSYITKLPDSGEAIDMSDFHCDFFSNGKTVLARMVKAAPELRYESVDDILVDLGGSLSTVPMLPSGVRLDSPLLIIESGPNYLARMVLTLRDGEMLPIGREHLAGGDTSISRKHLEFSRRGDRYYVRDVGSTNGTWVHGIMIDNRPVEIHHTDRIKVGDIFLRFVFMK